MAKSIRIGMVIIACLVGAAVGALSLPVGDAAAADPACPGSWPGQAYDGPLQQADHGRIAYQDFFTDSDGDRWFIIRSSDSNGYTSIRAYPATGDGYAANSPDEVCYLVVRKPGAAEDAANPTQIVFPTEQEEPKPAARPIDPQAAVVEQLQRNAAAFRYTTGKRGGNLTQAVVAGDPLTFNLAIANDATSVGYLSHLFEGLTETSWLTSEAEPGLAERWERSPDGLTWTFHLRRDVRWHDGTPFTAHDVEFTFERIIMNRDLPVVARSTFEQRIFDADTGAWRNAAAIQVTALDDHTVQFVLSLPFAAFLRAMETSIFPKHILEPHVDSGTFVSVWGVDTDPAQVIGTGPFVIQSYVPGESLTLERNPDYWLHDAQGNRLPYLDEIRYLIVPDRTAALSRFQAGETDIHGLPSEEYTTLKPLENAGNFTIHERGPGFGTSFLAFNMNPGQNAAGEHYVAPERLRWFTARQFRQAVAHAVDKDRIIGEIQHGRGTPQWSSISPAAGVFHNPNVRRYEYDIARANSILDSLGWTDTDNNGTREDDSGNDIEFSLATVKSSDTSYRMGSIIRDGIQAIGLKVNHQQVDFGHLVGQLTATYDWEAVIIGLTGEPDPGDGLDVWLSSGSLHLWHPNQPQPATAWEAEIDDLYIRASQELDPARRIALYHRAQEVIAENIPLIYTTLGIRTTAARNVFGNTTATLFGLWDIRYLYRTDR